MNWRSVLGIALLAAALISGISAWRNRANRAPEAPQEGVNDFVLANFQIISLDKDGKELAKPVTVRALPDMLTFSPDGKLLLVAGEGEPNTDYSVDPEGTMSIINVAKALANK